MVGGWRGRQDGCRAPAEVVEEAPAVEDVVEGVADEVVEEAAEAVEEVADAQRRPTTTPDKTDA